MVPRTLAVLCSVVVCILVVDFGEKVGGSETGHGDDRNSHMSHPYWEHWRCTHTREEFLRLFYSTIKRSKYSCHSFEQNMTSPELSVLAKDHHFVHRPEKQDWTKSEELRTLIFRNVNNVANRRKRTASKNADETTPSLPAKATTTETKKKQKRRKRSDLLQDGGSDIVFDTPQQTQTFEESWGHEGSIGFSDSSLNGTEMHLDTVHLKKLRGCHWLNESHYCVQYIIFAVEEPHCVALEGVNVTELAPETHDKNTDENEEEIINDILESEEVKPPLSKVWSYGLASCTAVIIVGRLGVMIVPILPRKVYKSFVISTVGLAAGTLTGSSIFHLLPKAFSLENQYDKKKSLNRCLVIASGLWLFLVIERVLKILLHHKERIQHQSRRVKVHNVLASNEQQEENSVVSVVSVGRKFSNGKIKFTPEGPETEEGAKCQRDECIKGCICGNPQIMSKFDVKIPTIRFQEGKLSAVSTQAWMIIVGDSFLDFVDGLSMGTAFQDSLLTGFSISLGILLDEIPHELGEFAVLLTSGLSFYQALLYKAIASCSTYLGLAVGIWLGGIESGHYVFALAAGMFLYIAMVDMIPELNEAALKSTKISVKKGVKVLILQNIGLLLGMAVIYVMALYEDVFRKF